MITFLRSLIACRGVMICRPYSLQNGVWSVRSNLRLSFYIVCIPLLVSVMCNTHVSAKEETNTNLLPNNNVFTLLEPTPSSTIFVNHKLGLAYGTIPTTGPPNLEYISRAKQRIKAGLGTRRPWKAMLNFRSLKVPGGGAAEALSRVVVNVSYFRMNYAMVALLILFLSLLWHPISLIVFLLLMAAWLFLYFLRDEPLVLLGHLVDDRLVLVAMAILTVALLLLTDATVNILVAVAVAVVVVVAHAAFRRTEDLFLGEEEEAAAAALVGAA